METSRKKELNAIPVATFRWLKLNHLQLEVPLVEPELPFNKDYLKNNEFNPGTDQDIRIIKMNGPVQLPGEMIDFQTKNTEYGVSKEFVSECENSYNCGICVYIPEGRSVTVPIRVDYVLDQDNRKVVDYNIIYAAPHSSVTLVIDYSSADQSETTHIGAMKVYADEGSQITIVKLQRLNDNSHHFDSNISFVNRNAKVNYVQVELGSKHSVTNYKNNLTEAGEADLASIYFGDGDRLIDLNYLMEHQGRRSKSNILTRGALKDHAVKTFRGTIDFQLGASKSEGSEEEYVILFDKNVKSNAIPLLLCSEDDVKGQHAASAGKVDSEKLFYMMSRGFDKEEAMKLIVEASFHPILEKIPFQDLRTAIGEEIHRRLMNENA